MSECSVYLSGHLQLNTGMTASITQHVFETDYRHFLLPFNSLEIFLYSRKEAKVISMSLNSDLQPGVRVLRREHYMLRRMRKHLTEPLET
jgi:hypothetical protein